MNSLRNLPIILRYEDDGTILAQCPLLPDCQCRSTSRFDAIRTMQQLIKHAQSTKKIKYEVIHLAVAATSESADGGRKKLPKQRPVDRPLIEVL
ncbi:hypothetical protein LZC95_49145 [Pendulispora brunnea]|uniref:Uncharacterized protein n=1 Tax=Pendulispora brunnea TaxID=2905690 RepID=A0ABZ2KDE8_9BACT